MNLTDRSTHFEFGRNWASYAKLVDESRLESAAGNVAELCGDLEGKSFLDIGSGSGLLSLAALKLGAARVLAVDIDENSVNTTRAMLAGQAGDWEARRISVFDLPDAELGRFDVVYSWGVLHHTGDMWKAIDAAASMVKPGGTFVLALYARTPLCGAWRLEKRLYRKSPKVVQKIAQFGYLTVYGIGLALSGRNPVKKLRGQRERGMDTMHDIHDWMGGYPYESTSPGELDAHLRPLGFEAVKTKPIKPAAFGLLGSACSEYVYRRTG
jgi:2-polyprenyl-6-hydroxyphenyl methylase/3-demethylubiquinone-9 3-methyltransferase